MKLQRLKENFDKFLKEGGQNDNGYIDDDEYDEDSNRSLGPEDFYNPAHDEDPSSEYYNPYAKLKQSDFDKIPKADTTKFSFIDCAKTSPEEFAKKNTLIGFGGYGLEYTKEELESIAKERNADLVFVPDFEATWKKFIELKSKAKQGA